MAIRAMELIIDQKNTEEKGVLKNAGFYLKDGEIHALMDENGAGKSTLMKILTGVYTRDAGTVLVDSHEVCYPICTLCRDHAKAGFAEGSKVGLRLWNELR